MVGIIQYKVSRVMQVTFRLRADLDERLEQYHDISHIPKTVIMELALEEYLDKMLPVKSKLRTKK